MYINNKFPSPNFSFRTKKIEYIILHYTEMFFEDALSKLIDNKSNVSCHYLIKENGEIFQLVQDNMIAWHAGASYWQNSEKLNQNSLGIEIDNLGNCEFPMIQMQACIDLCHKLLSKYNIKSTNIVGHSDIAPSRKIDPGIFFDWRMLSQNGLGIWPKNAKYSKSLAENILFSFGQNNLGVIKLQQNLGMLGYKIEISGNMDIQTNNVIRAFQSHFCVEIINNKGGLEFFRNPESLYNWDSFSEHILQELISFHNIL